MVKHISHKRSIELLTNGEPKKPSTDAITEGEIAINYSANKERLFIKNSNTEIVDFVPSHYIETNYAPLIKKKINNSGYISRPNTYYDFGEISNATFTLIQPSNTEVYNEYMGKFTVTADNASILFPSDIKWAGNLKYIAGCTYEFSIVDGLGIMVCYNNN